MRQGSEQADPTSSTPGGSVFSSLQPILPKEAGVGVRPNATQPGWVLLTFGPCEQQLVRGVQAEDGLGVALGHGDALQGGRPCTLGSSNGGDDAPSRERGERGTCQPGRLRPGWVRYTGKRGCTQRGLGLMKKTPETPAKCPQRLRAGNRLCRWGRPV